MDGTSQDVKRSSTNLAAFLLQAGTKESIGWQRMPTQGTD